MDASRVTERVIDYKKIMGHNDCLEFILIYNGRKINKKQTYLTAKEIFQIPVIKALWYKPGMTYKSTVVPSTARTPFCHLGQVLAFALYL